MEKRLLAVLNDTERLLVAETEADALAYDEDQVAALHDRIRRARGKYVSQYRRQASARVSRRVVAELRGPRIGLRRTKRKCSKKRWLV